MNMIKSRIYLAIFIAWAVLSGFLFTPVGGPIITGSNSGPASQQVWWNCSGGTSSFQKAPCTASSAITQTARTAISTYVVKLNSAAYTAPSGASKITLNLYTPVTTQQILSTVYAGFAATTGAGNCSAVFCAWDFSAAPTQLFFPVSGTDCSSTQANHTFPPAAVRTTFATCSTAFTWSGGHLMFAFDGAVGTTVTITETISAATMVIPQPVGFNVNMYNCWKAGTNINQAATVSKNSGYVTCDSGATVNSRGSFIQSITAQ